MMYNKEHEQKRIVNLIAGKQLNGKYKIGGKIASGTYGVVFFAIDKHANPYAIKAIDLSILDRQIDPLQKQKLRERIDQEEEAMRACNCDFVMKCIQCLNDDKNNLKLIVMEYCSFGSLQLIIDQRGHIPQTEARIILKQILLGLAAFHQKGRLHRDVKTDNICGMNNRFILADFGSASIFFNSENPNEQRDWRCTYNVRKTNVGSPLSTAPQVLKEQQFYGTKADLYSVGILFYQMLTGTYPFFMKKNSDPQTILCFIEKNIDNIYKPQYIKSNLKEDEKQNEGCSTLSLQAINFLKKLIVFDQKKRAGWKIILQDPYLSEAPILHGLQLSECVLPLQSIDWKMVKHEMDKKMKKSYIEGIEQYECPTNQYEITATLVKEYQPLSQAQILELRTKFINLNKQRDELVRTIRIINHQVRLLELLKQIYGQIMEIKDIKNDKVLRMISSICEIRAREVEDLISKNSNNFIGNYKHGSLLDLFKGLKESDQIYFQQEYCGIQHYVKSNWFYPTKKNQFYQFLKGKRDNNPNQCMKIVRQHIRPQCKKLIQQIGDRKISNNLEQFLNFPKEIVWATYTASNGYWYRWDSLKTIRKLAQK